MQSAAKNGGKNSSRSYTPGRIHVSRLPNNITSQDMWVHFSRFGTVVEANVFNTNYNNFGYVTFADPAIVDRLIGENSPVIQIIKGATAIINRAWADNPGGGSQAYRGGGSGSRGGGEGSAGGSSSGVRPEIRLENYLVPELLAILNSSGENSQGSSQCSGGVSTTAGSRIQRPPGFLFQEHTDVWGQPPAPTSSTPLPRPRPQTPPSLPVPPPLALSEGSPLPTSSTPLPRPRPQTPPSLSVPPPLALSEGSPLPSSSTPLPRPQTPPSLPVPPPLALSEGSPLPTSSTPLPRPRPQTPPSLPVPPPLALSEGSPLPSSTPPPPATSAPPPPPATSSTSLPELPSSTSPPPATSSTPLSLSISEWPPLESSVPRPPQILKKKSRDKQ